MQMYDPPHPGMLIADVLENGNLRTGSSVTALAKHMGVTRAALSRAEQHQLVQQLIRTEFQVAGKSLNKDEFVTCGGVRLGEVDFKTMESRICPGLYFAGELLDIDGITGGFNFQAAWTTGWIAGRAMASCIQSLDEPGNDEDQNLRRCGN